MPTIFGSKSIEDRRKLFLYGCIPTRFVIYITTAILLVMFPKIIGPIIATIGVIGISIMLYQSYTSHGWWLRWPHILIWGFIVIIGILSYFFPKVAYIIIPVLVIDIVLALAMYSIRFK